MQKTNSKGRGSVTCRSVRARLLLIAVVQISACAFLLSYLGYGDAVDIASRRTNDIVDERFLRITSATDASLRPLLRAVHALHEWMQPVASQLLSSRTVSNVSGFWHIGLQEMHQNLAWSIPFLYSYGCQLENLSMNSMPRDAELSIQLSIADDTVPMGQILLGTLTNWTIPETSWNSLSLHNIASNATFQSLLRSGQLHQLSTLTKASDPSWYAEALGNGDRQTWTSPFIARDGRYWLGAGQGIMLPGVSNPVGACSAQLSTNDLDNAITAVSPGAEAQYVLLRSDLVYLPVCADISCILQCRPSSSKSWKVGF